MRKFLFFTTMVLGFYLVSAQSSNFSVLLKQKSSDTELVNKLKIFEQGGIEKSLELGSVTSTQIIDTAKSYIGTPHCMGGITHKCIDCSGLLYATFKSVGINIPHSSQEIARYGEIILNMDSLQAGDLVFFVKTYNTSKVITHAGIYLDNDKFIHTSASHGVVISNLKSNYYTEHYIYGTRIFKTKKIQKKHK